MVVPANMSITEHNMLQASLQRLEHSIEEERASQPMEEDEGDYDDGIPQVDMYEEPSRG